MNKEELVKKRVALIKEMETLTKSKEQLTEDESNKFDELEAQIKVIDESIAKIDKLAELAKAIPGPIGPEVSEHDKKDLDKYSIAKAIFKQFEAITGKGRLDGIELEMHQEAVEENKRAGIPTAGLGIPTMAHSRADLQATVDAAGGYTVATELPGFIDTLKNTMVTLNAGARFMTGLEGDLSFPKATANSTSTWRSEGGISTQSDPTFGVVTMTPHRLTTYTEYTAQLLRQSSIDIEKFVRENLYYSIANALETTVFTGSGSSNVPGGLFSLGINDGDHGSNGTVLNWANVVQLESMVATDNALKGRPAYITNATAAGKMKTTLKTDYQGGFIWEIFSPVVPKGMINGYDAYVTNVISNASSRGSSGAVVSSLVFGDWTSLMIGQWGGGLDLIVNPYSLDTYATIRVVIAGYYDIEVTHPEAFAAIEGLETA